MDQKTMPMSRSTLQGETLQGKTDKDSIKESVAEVKSAQSKGSKANIRDSATIEKTPDVPTLPETSLVPEPCEEMFVYASSTGGVIELNNLFFKCYPEFKAGNYIIICREVTKGLPPRMKMKNTKVLLKLVNLDPEPEVEVTKGGKDPKGKKK